MTPAPGILGLVLLLVASAAGSTRSLALADARPVLAALGDQVPAELRHLSGSDADARWSAWLARRDATIRGRMARGDEDSVVNLLLYGTSFTRWPRATPAALPSASDAALAAVMNGRVSDLAAAIESPGDDERLRFVRSVVERDGAPAGVFSRQAARRYLTRLRSRVLAENEHYMRRLADAAASEASRQRAAQATLYRDRGLSSDTSLRVDFALEQTLAALRDRGELAGRPAARIGVIGPGLDFLDKGQGYDLFPVQTIQPFALIDSLRRLGLAERPTVTALDLSPRVLAHVREARAHALRGEPYRLNVLIEKDTAMARLEPALAEYWRRFGDRIGGSAESAIPEAYAGQVRGRTVTVRPEVVLDVRDAELNVVTERVSDAAFDLIVATNVLIYYDSFDQALALKNIASMLRDGALLMTNQPVPMPVVCGLSPVLIISVDFDRVQSGSGPHRRGDSIFVYRKQPAAA
jgi:hypothetical protein